MVTKQTNAVVNATQDFAIGQRDATQATGGDRTYNWQLEFYANAEQADKTARNFSVADNYVRRLGLEPTEQARNVYHLRRESWERERRLMSEADSVTIANMHIVAQERQRTYLEAEQRAAAQAVIQEIQRAQEQAQQQRRQGGQQPARQQQQAQPQGQEEEREVRFVAPEQYGMPYYVYQALENQILPYVKNGRVRVEREFRGYWAGGGWNRIVEGDPEVVAAIRDAAVQTRNNLYTLRAAEAVPPAHGAHPPAPAAQPAQQPANAPQAPVQPPQNQNPPRGGNPPQGGAPPAAPVPAPRAPPANQPAQQPAPQAPRHANVPAPANPPAQGPVQPAQAAQFNASQWLQNAGVGDDASQYLQSVRDTLYHDRRQGGAVQPQAPVAPTCYRLRADPIAQATDAQNAAYLAVKAAAFNTDIQDLTLDKNGIRMLFGTSRKSAVNKRLKDLWNIDINGGQPFVDYSSGLLTYENMTLRGDAAHLARYLLNEANPPTVILTQITKKLRKNGSVTSNWTNQAAIPKPPTMLELVKSKLGLYDHVFKYKKNPDGTLTVGFGYENAANGSDIYNRWILPSLKAIGKITEGKSTLEGQKFAAVTKVEHDKSDEAHVMNVLEALKKDVSGRWITSRAAKLAVKRAADAKAVSKWFSYRQPVYEVEPLTFAERLAEDGISFAPPAQSS